MYIDPGDTQWSHWTLDSLTRLVATFSHEPGWFDFKEVLTASRPQQRDQHAVNIRKTASAMANADGGFIIFGVRDPDRYRQQSPFASIVGLDAGTAFPNEFGNVIKHIEPQLIFEVIPSPIVVERDPAGEVFVVRIPKGPDPPYMADGRFWTRGNGGNAVTMPRSKIVASVLETNARRSRLLALIITLQKQLEDSTKLDPNWLMSVTYRFDTDLLGKRVLEVTSDLGADVSVRRWLEAAKDATAKLNLVLDHVLRTSNVNAWDKKHLEDAKAALNESVEKSLGALTKLLDQ